MSEGFKNFFGVVDYRHTVRHESDTNSTVELIYEDGRRVGPVELTFEELGQLQQMVRESRSPSGISFGGGVSPPHDNPDLHGELSFTGVIGPGIIPTMRPVPPDGGEGGSGNDPPDTDEPDLDQPDFDGSIKIGPVVIEHTVSRLEPTFSPPSGFQVVGSGGASAGGSAEVETVNPIEGNQPAATGSIGAERQGSGEPPSPTAARILGNAQLRAEAVVGIDHVIVTLESTELNDTEGTMATVALVSLRRAKAILTLDWEAVSDAVLADREQEIKDIRGALEKVREWFIRKADSASTGVIVVVLTQLLARL